MPEIARRTSKSNPAAAFLSPDNLKLYELQKPFVEPLLMLCRAFNTTLDTAFYDIDVLKTELAARGRTVGTGWPANTALSTKPTDVLDLSAITNPSGSVIIVDANRAPYVGLPFTDMKEFFEATGSVDGATLHTLAITGVGSSALGAVAFAWDVSTALGEPVAAIVPGYGVADVIPQALGGWFGFEVYGAIQSATQLVLAHVAPSLAAIGKDLALSTPGRPHAETGAPVFRKGSAASDDVHAILEHVPGITRLVGHSKGALAIENALRSLSPERQQHPLDILTFGCVISEQFEKGRYFQSLGLIDGLGHLNSWGRKPESRPATTHTTNTKRSFSMKVRKIVHDVSES